MPFYLIDCQKEESRSLRDTPAPRRNASKLMDFTPLSVLRSGPKVQYLILQPYVAYTAPLALFNYSTRQFLRSGIFLHESLSF